MFQEGTADEYQRSHRSEKSFISAWDEDMSTSLSLTCFFLSHHQHYYKSFSSSSLHFSTSLESEKLSLLFKLSLQISHNQLFSSSSIAISHQEFFYLIPHLLEASIIMKKVIVKVEINEDKIKQKAMKAVSGISGVESVSMDMKGKKLTLTGDIDAVHVVSKLRKICHTEIISVGPAKEEKKDESKTDDKKKDSTKVKMIDPLPLMYYGTNNYYNQMKPQYNPYYSAVSVEEDPNSCVII